MWVVLGVHAHDVYVAISEEAAYSCRVLGGPWVCGGQRSSMCVWVVSESYRCACGACAISGRAQAWDSPDLNPG